MIGVPFPASRLCFPTTSPLCRIHFPPNMESVSIPSNLFGCAVYAWLFIFSVVTFVDVRFFIVMLFLLTYQPYVCEESMRYDNLLQSFAEFYDVDESVTYTNLVRALVATHLPRHLKPKRTHASPTAPPLSSTTSSFSLCVFSTAISQIIRFQSW